MQPPFSGPTPALPNRVVHLDLKGTPPSFPRLLQLLDLFAALRFTAVLVEWEDAFPWSIDPTFRSATAYTEEEVGQFVAHAESLGLELIPLVQTLGHMENFLKADEKVALREVPADNDVLNPLAPGAGDLVRSIVLDVLRLMPRVRRLHLGGDEAWTFGTHPDTQAAIRQHGAAALYLHHVEPLLQFLAERNIRPILWHDMMIKWDDAALARLAPQCDLVVWGYGGHPDHIEHHYSSRHTARFAALGFTLWGGSAFKGADGLDRSRPNPASRRLNAQAWLEIAHRHHFTGLITTGWSRYCFNAPQCESIEASLDTLLEQALLMYDGISGDTSGEAIIDKAPDLLAQLWSPQEAERFRQIRDAATAYSATVDALWQRIRLIETQRSTARLDCLKTAVSLYTRDIPREFANLRAAAQAYRALLEPLVPGHWLDQYFAERESTLERLLSPLQP